ncbi:MAG: hypothetical protein HYR84_15385, partial [Planctomycetes bacterium]|nr:hypothetical protein [Planctomycetota bacterium]
VNPIPTKSANLVQSHFQKKRADDAEALRKAEQEKDAIEKARQLDALRAATKLALQRGGSRDVLVLMEKAGADGTGVTPDLQLHKVRALIALGKIQEALKEINRLDHAALAPELQPTFEVLHGALWLGTDDRRAAELLRKAAIHGRTLPAAEREFALGLLADSIPDSLRHFESAIALDSFHLDARIMAAHSLLSLGRFDDLARLSEVSLALSPKHPHFLFFLAIASSGKDDMQSANAYLARLEVEVPNDDFRVARTVVQIVLPEVLKPGASGEFPNVVKIFLANNDLELLDKKLKGVLDGNGINWRAPPSARRGIHFLLTEHLMQLGRIGIPSPILSSAGLDKNAVSLFAFDDEPGDQKARAKLKAFPEGTAKYYYAIRKAEIAKKAKESNLDDDHALQLAAAVALVDAARTPSLLGTEAAAMDLAILHYLRVTVATKDPKQRSELAAQTVKLVRERRLMPRRLTTDAWNQHVAAAREAGEYGFGLFLIDEWQKVYKFDHARQKKARARILELELARQKTDSTKVEKGSGGK